MTMANRSWASNHKRGKCVYWKGYKCRYNKREAIVMLVPSKTKWAAFMRWGVFSWNWNLNNIIFWSNDMLLLHHSAADIWVICTTPGWARVRNVLMRLGCFDSEALSNSLPSPPPPLPSPHLLPLRMDRFQIWGRMSRLDLFMKQKDCLHVSATLCFCCTLPWFPHDDSSLPQYPVLLSNSIASSFIPASSFV